MNRDPLYKKVVEGLNGPLDGNVFQQCAVALIGKAHPNLAPLPGGDDAGMDGAFGTAEGPFPLVCTVRKDVIGNFRKNISTYLSNRNGPKAAVVATSQSLTNKRKRNLEKAAGDLGLRLVNIYDAPYFANKLYSNAKWRLELLGISGDPPALSVLPQRGRFAQPDLLVGRIADLDWLKSAQGDVLVVGQPGSGKTYLHQHLAAKGLCLFAVDGSRTQLADAIREQQPSIIVIDDAHIHCALVEELIHLRAELGSEFHIHLNSWPHHEQKLQRLLNIRDASVRHLEPLRRQEILVLIESLGIRGPDWLQHLIISQAEGKPGLAVALAELSKTHDIDAIWSGDAAARHFLDDARLVKDEAERCVLAAFAVGGDAGMSVSQVAQALKLTPIEIRELTATLGAGGLIEEVAEDRLQVRPHVIRPILVRDGFYCGARSHPIDELLNAVSSIKETATVLFAAKQRGAGIEQSVLERFVVAANSAPTWEHFAWIDARCAEDVLAKYPEKICQAAPALLSYLPSRTLHELLDADELNGNRSRDIVEDPRRRISEWLSPFDAAPETTVERRRLLLAVLEERVKQGRIAQGPTFAWAVAELLGIAFDTTRPSPGNSREIRLISGVASHAIIEKIAAFWPRIRELVRHVPANSARIVFDQLENWCLPQRLSVKARLSEETFAMVKGHGEKMLADLLAMPHCNRAWRTSAARIAGWAEFDDDVSVDPDFDAIYADRDRSLDWKTEQENRTNELNSIADRLCQRPVQEVLTYLEEIRSEAEGFAHRNPDGHLPMIYWRISQTVSDPWDWIEAMIARRSSSLALAQFVERVTRDGSEIDRLLMRLLRCPDYQTLAIARILRTPTVNEELLDAAVELLAEPALAGDLWLHDAKVSVATMRRLLTHSNPIVRGAAAVGEWQREPEGTVRDELRSEWRQAIRDVHPNHYALIGIFEKNADLAFEWLDDQIRRGNRDLNSYDQAVATACNAITLSQRQQLLGILTRAIYTDDVFDLLIGEHIELYAGWLEFQCDKYLRLRPLDRDVGLRWERMALMALEAGVTPEDLADHCTPIHWGGSGPLSRYFVPKIAAYEALSNHADLRLRPAGRRGLEWAKRHEQHERQRERREEVYGLE